MRTGRLPSEQLDPFLCLLLDQHPQEMHRRTIDGFARVLSNGNENLLDAHWHHLDTYNI